MPITEPLVIVCANKAEVQKQSYKNTEIIFDELDDVSAFYNQCIIEYPESILYFVGKDFSIQDENAILKVINYWYKYSSLGSILYTDGYCSNGCTYVLSNVPAVRYNAPFFFNNYVNKRDYMFSGDKPYYYNSIIEGLKLGHKLIHFAEPIFNSTLKTQEIVNNA